MTLATAHDAHEHPDDGDSQVDHSAFDQFVYSLDNVDLTTIGVDVGSSTFHLMFSSVHLQRDPESPGSRFEVVDTEVLWRSPITLTPHRGRRIDADTISTFVRDCHLAADLDPTEIDSGAVILTGEALRRDNARAVADAVAAGSGKFVCVSAGHHLEAMLAAYGSGAAALSKEHGERLLHIDIGGGTTKLALIEDGKVRATAAVMVGGRQVSWDADRRVVATSAGLQAIARAAGVDVEVGTAVTAEAAAALVATQASVIIAIAAGGVSPLEQRLRLTKRLPKLWEPDAITFSGGVSEFVYGRESGEYGDLGPELGAAIRNAIVDGSIVLPVHDPGEGIRATVVGASQCSVQLSGSTVLVTAPELLPLRNVPVVHPDLAEELADEDWAMSAVAAAVDKAVAQYGVPPESPLALAFSWRGAPSFRRLFGLASGIARSSCGAGEAPLVLLIDDDIGRVLGRILIHDAEVRRPVICLDGLDMAPLDYVDVGKLIEPSGALPVVIKSLLFGNER